MGLVACMSEPFSLAKMVGGWFTGLHWAKTISFGLSAAFLIFIGIGVWRGYFKKADPTQSTEQNAEKIENFYYNPKSTFGCVSIEVERYTKPPTNGVIWQK